MFKELAGAEVSRTGTQNGWRAEVHRTGFEQSHTGQYELGYQNQTWDIGTQDGMGSDVNRTACAYKHT